MDHFDSLHTFVAVAESGSFTAAAERLDIAKSAVSRRVSDLEERLGAQLITRTTRSLNLTETGRSFYERSAQILADLAEAESAVAQEHGELRGRLRVALPLSFSLHHMCRPISEFIQTHPNVKFDLDLNDRRVDLVDDGLDLALRIGRLDDSSLIARKIFDTQTVLCAGPEYLQRYGTPKTPHDLAEHICLAYTNLADPGRWHYKDTAGDKHSAKIKPALTVNNGDFLCSVASHNIGIVMQPTFIAHAAIKNGDLIPILTEYEWPNTSAYAVYPPTRHLSYRVRAFIDYLVAYFAGRPSWDQDCNC